MNRTSNARTSRRVLVTGAGGGMGLAAARRLAGDYTELVLVDRQGALAASAADVLSGHSRSVEHFTADVSRAEEVDLLAQEVLARGEVDVLINVVGGIAGPVTSDFWDIDDHDWDATIRVNLSSAFFMMRALAPPMRARGWGRIVNVSSVSWGGDAARAHYSAAKAGLVALTRSASDSLVPHGVTVNAVAPGRTDTGFGGRTDVQLPDSTDPPSGRRNDPMDVAEAIAFFVGDNARQVSGELVVVAGGRNPSL